MKDARRHRLFGALSEQESTLCEFIALQTVLEQLPDEDALRLQEILRSSLSEIQSRPPSKSYGLLRELLGDVAQAARMTLRFEAAKRRIHARRTLGWS